MKKLLFILSLAWLFCISVMAANPVGAANWRALGTNTVTDGKIYVGAVTNLSLHQDLTSTNLMVSRGGTNLVEIGGDGNLKPEIYFHEPGVGGYSTIGQANGTGIFTSPSILNITANDVYQLQSTTGWQLWKGVNKLGEINGSSPTMPRFSSRTVIDRRNVDYWGAIGDNVADDTAAINAAIAAFRSEATYFNMPALEFSAGKVYRTTGPIDLTSISATAARKFVIHGNGAIIHPDFAGGIAVDSTGSKFIYVYNLVVNNSTNTVSYPDIGWFQAETDTGAQSGNQYFYDVHVSGNFKYACWYNYGVEENGWLFCEAQGLQCPAIICTTTNFYNIASTFQTVNPAGPISCTLNSFYRCGLSSGSTTNPAIWMRGVGDCEILNCYSKSQGPCNAEFDAIGTALGPVYASLHCEDWSGTNPTNAVQVVGDVTGLDINGLDIRVTYSNSLQANLLLLDTTAVNSSSFYFPATMAFRKVTIGDMVLRGVNITSPNGVVDLTDVNRVYGGDFKLHSRTNLINDTPNRGYYTLLTDNTPIFVNPVDSQEITNGSIYRMAGEVTYHPALGTTATVSNIVEVTGITPKDGEMMRLRLANTNHVITLVTTPVGIAGGNIQLAPDYDMTMTGPLVVALRWRSDISRWVNEQALGMFGGDFATEAKAIVAGDGKTDQGMSIYSGDGKLGTIYFARDKYSEGGYGYYAGGIIYDHNLETMTLRTRGGNDAVTINGSQNVSVLGPLTVKQGAGTGVTITNTASQVGLAVNGFSGQAANVATFGSGGTNYWYIDKDGNLLAGVDNKTDIGADSTFRPKNVNVAGYVKAGGNIYSSGNVNIGSANTVIWTSRGYIGMTGDGVHTLYNSAGTGYTGLRLGPDAASPASSYVNAASGSGTDKNGGSLTLEGGQSTGTGRGGGVVMRTSTTSTTGSSANAYQDRARYVPKYIDLTDNTATTLFTVALPATNVIGIQFVCTVQASDGTDFQSLTTPVTVDAVAKTTTITTVVAPTAAQTAVAASSAATLSVTYTVVDAGSNVLAVKATADTSFGSPTYLRAKIVMTAINGIGTGWSITEI